MFASRILALADVPSSNFQGYVWFSDSSNPIELKNETFQFDSITVNPFIVEALLYSEELRMSYHIKHSGAYVITAYDWSLISDSETMRLKEKKYLSNRIDASENLKFVEVWLLESDNVTTNTNGTFQQWNLKAEVFKGF